LANLQPEQQLALIRETETAVFLIHEGLLSLNRIDGANDFYHGPLGLLSQGFERLMKVVVCLGELEDSGVLPTVQDIRRVYGHDLRKLKDAVVLLAQPHDDFIARPAVRADIDFMQKDSLLGDLIDTMAEFGDAGRYYNLDLLLEGRGASPKVRRDPDDLFRAIERGVLHGHPEWVEKVGEPAELQSFYRTLSAELTRVLQRFTRALCRFFTLGPLGSPGKRLTGTVKAFLFLQDDDLSDVPSRWYER
jgi:hypothetical protein